MLAFLLACCLSARKKRLGQQTLIVLPFKTSQHLAVRKMNKVANTNQLNPYAIQLCTLSRWISAKQWAPAGSGNFSIRLNDHSALVTPQHQDKAELSPQDLALLTWHNTHHELSPKLAACTLLHSTIYQQFCDARVVLQTQSLAAIVFSKLIKAEQHLFCGYDLQQRLQPQAEPHSGLSLAILDSNTPWIKLAEELRRRQHELCSVFLLRGQGLYVWGEGLEQAKQRLEAWEFLLSCELERLKVSGQW